jgi:hypothetical protein
MTTHTLARHYLAAVPALPEGASRDREAFKVAAKVIERFELPNDDLVGLLIEWDTNTNHPVMGESDIRKCFASARRSTEYNPARTKAATAGKRITVPDGYTAVMVPDGMKAGLYHDSHLAFAIGPVAQGRCNDLMEHVTAHTDLGALAPLETVQVALLALRRGLAQLEAERDALAEPELETAPVVVVLGGRPWPYVGEETVGLTEAGEEAVKGRVMPALNPDRWWKDMAFCEAVIEPGHDGPTGSRMLDRARAKYREEQRHEAAMQAIDAEYDGQYDDPRSSKSSEKVNCK